MTPLTRAVLAEYAEDADRRVAWPAASWNALAAAGVFRWSVPVEYGGDGLPPAELHRRTEHLAAACPTTAFILSQREAAVRLLQKGPEELRRRVLTAAAAGRPFLTVGLSQLTTSRQHGGPALTAAPDGPGYRLDGVIPWVTGADRAGAVVAGAVLADGRQVLFALPPSRPGVTVGRPMPLAALAGSRTAEIQCAGARIEPADVILGPVEQVLGPVGGGGLETSNLAIGLAAAAVEYLAAEAGTRPAFAPVAAAFTAALADARRRLTALADGPNPDAALALRGDCTRIALRSTQAALLAAKGAGFVVPHPAQRWARQALFFLVWSCPRPVADAVLADLFPPLTSPPVGLS